MLKNYYTSIISGDLYKAYRFLELGIRERTMIIQVPCISADEFFYVLNAYQRENPLSFWVNYWQGVPAQFAGKNVFIKPRYEYVDKIKEVEAAFQRACNEIGTYRYDPLRQVMAIVNWMSKLRYVNTMASHEHNIVGPLLYGQGVCEAFSQLFKAFCDHFNIDCMVAVGSVDGYADLHAWNVINFSGNNYNVDMTVSIDIAKKTGNQLCNVLVPDYVVDYYHSDNKPFCGVLKDNPYFLQGKAFVTVQELSDMLVKYSRTSKQFTLLDGSKAGIDVIKEIDHIPTGDVKSVSGMFRLYTFYC